VHVCVLVSVMGAHASGVQTHANPRHLCATNHYLVPLLKASSRAPPPPPSPLPTLRSQSHGLGLQPASAPLSRASVSVRGSARR
jgi:hypothetical protein